MRKTRLLRYGQLMRMDEGNKVKQTMKKEVRGTRGKGRRRMGWVDNIRHDMSKFGLEEGEDG